MPEQLRQPGGPDPKPDARIRDPHAGLEKMRREGRCRVCAGRYLLSRHHVVPKGQRGDDVDENLVPLCGECHGALHRDDQPQFRGGRTIGQVLRVKLRADELAYIVAKKGEAWLDAHYPRPT